MVLAWAFAWTVFALLAPGARPGTVLGDLPGAVADTFLRADLGAYGARTGGDEQSVAGALWAGLPADVALILGGLVCGVAIGTAGAVLAARRPGRLADRGGTLGASAALSVPVYWLGYMVLILFAPASGRWPVAFVSDQGAYRPLTSDPVAWLGALWVPWLVLGLPVAALVFRLGRSSLVDALRAPFVDFARAKGLRERRVVLRHALSAAAPPVLALIAANMALVVTSAILIEPAFNLPGAFRLADVGQFVGSEGDPRRPDNAIVLGLVLEAAALIALLTLVADLLHALLDPKVRTGGASGRGERG